MTGRSAFPLSMLSSLASVLFLGIVAPPPAHALPLRVPGIEVLSVAQPTSFRHPLVNPSLSASGAILVDAQSGEEIFAKDAETPRPMASLTKIMTALLVLEKRPFTRSITIPAIAESIPGSTVGLIPGDRLSIENLLKALLLPSANDAAYALAAVDGPGLAVFIQRMNDRAAALGLRNTHFQNPAGLDHPEQYASPRDLAWLTLAALREPKFQSIVQTKSAEIISSEGKKYELRNTNEMLQYNDEVFGVKTGTTDAAGECLVTLFEEKQRRYLLVLLGSKDRYTDSLKVLKAVRDASQ